ncbi:hypothetical protein F8388_020605, partial [Cannabis sativa]
VVLEVVATKKKKFVSDDASASKKSETKDAVEDSNLDKVCESNVADDEKLVNVVKKPVSKSHGKRKSDTPVDVAPWEYYFKVDVKKRFAGKPQLYNPYSVIKDINKNLSDDQKELFRKSHFGHFLDIHNERDDVQLWFKLGNKAVRFGIEEFSLITGLDCKKSYDLLGFKEDIFSMHGTTEKIALNDGNDTFEQLAKKRKIEKGYKLEGFPISFLIWLYEIIPSLSPRFCKRIGNKSPHVLNWENNPTSKFSELIQNVLIPNTFPKGLVILCVLMKLFMRSRRNSQWIEENSDGNSKDSEFFSSPVREAYYQDISDDGGGLQLSVQTSQAKEERDSLNFENIFVDPDFLKGVVDSTVKSALKTDDVSFHDIEDLMRIVQDDKFIVHGINPFKDKIGYNIGPEQLVKFSNFIDENIIMNRGVKKYSDADNLLSPPMNFSFIKIFEKMWFYQLHACGEFLCDSHLDVVFYYLRKNIKQDDTLNQRITTDCLFDQVLTDHVLIYVNIQKQKHWILVNFDINERMLNVYNSMSGAINKKHALDHVKAYSTMLPFYLEYLDVYSSRPDLNLVEGPYFVGKREPLNFNDCGVFVIKFAHLFICEKFDDISSKMSDLVAVYRDDLAVSLFLHARRKQIGGYIIDDEVLKNVKKSKDNANNKANMIIQKFKNVVASQMVFLILVATLSVPGSQIKLKMRIFSVPGC